MARSETVVSGRRICPVVTVVMLVVVVSVVMVTGAGASPRRPAETIVGKMVSGGPTWPVMRLTIPADRSTLLSTVQSVVSFGGAGQQPQVTGRPETVTTSVSGASRQTTGTGRPELVTASVPETALDLPQTPTTSSAAAAAATFNHSAAVHAFFGPEDAVTARPVKARRADGPQYRRVIAPVRPTPRQPVSAEQEEAVTAATQTITVAESLHCPQGNAFWPPTRQCVPIGKQGPCQEGNVIQVNVTGSDPVSCGCRPGHLAWTDGICYRRFSPGPCGQGGVICESESGPAECRCRSGYHKGGDGLCYLEYTQADCPTNNVFIQGQCVAKGPCPEGFFMVFSKREQRYTCGCPPGFLLVAAVNRCIRARTHCRHCVENLYRWPADGQFYRELTRGPCNATELLIQTDSGPVCGCGKYAASDRVSSFLEPTVRWPLDGRCYRLYGRGICPPGQWFVWSSPENRMPVCCPKGHFFWPANDQCYEEFTRGPCEKSKLFVSVLRNSVCTCDDQWGFTVLNPEDGTCYLRNTQGPCQPGFRFIGAKAGRKVCDCLPGEFYHQPSDKCFPLYRQGPCQSGQWLEFSATAGRAVCRQSPCPLLLPSGEETTRVPRARLLELPPPQTLVYWKVTDRCYQVGSQGPCSNDFRLQLDEYGISPMCQPIHESNQEEPVQAPLSELSRCPPGSYRAVQGLCLPVLVTSVEADTGSFCGLQQVWSSERGRCEPASPPPTASCPASYHPYPEAGLCVCPRRQYPDEDGSCRPSEFHGPGPLHWTIYNYQRKVQNHQEAAARRL